MLRGKSEEVDDRRVLEMEETRSVCSLSATTALVWRVDGSGALLCTGSGDAGGKISLVVDVGI